MSTRESSFSYIVPVSKKPTDLLVDYIRYFERLVLSNDWLDDKSEIIFASLLEVGSKALDGFSYATLASFSAIKKALVWESEPFRESNCSQLMKVSRNQSESLSAYIERSSGLVEELYPRFAAANKQCLIRDFFVHSLSTGCQINLWSAITTKLRMLWMLQYSSKVCIDLLRSALQCKRKKRIGSSITKLQMFCVWQSWSYC